MSEVFGITAVSLFNFHRLVSQRYRRRRIIILRGILQQPFYKRRLRKARLIIAGSINELNIHAELLSKYPAPVVVFDNPATLQSYVGLQTLDQPLDKPVLDYRFNPELIDYSKLFAAVDARKRSKLSRHKVDLLSGVISEYTIAGFLNLFNTFLYATTVPANRVTVRDLTVNFIFHDTDEGEYVRQLGNRIKITDKVDVPLKQMLEYLRSAKGKTLRAALKQSLTVDQTIANADGGARRTVKYKAIAAHYGIDRFELRNLIILYRSLNAKTGIVHVSKRKNRR